MCPSRDQVVPGSDSTLSLNRINIFSIDIKVAAIGPLSINFDEAKRLLGLNGSPTQVASIQILCLRGHWTRVLPSSTEPVLPINFKCLLIFRRFFTFRFCFCNRFSGFVFGIGCVLIRRCSVLLVRLCFVWFGVLCIIAIAIICFALFNILFIIVISNRCFLSRSRISFLWLNSLGRSLCCFICFHPFLAFIRWRVHYAFVKGLPFRFKFCCDRFKGRCFFFFD